MQNIPVSILLGLLRRGHLEFLRDRSKASRAGRWLVVDGGDAERLYQDFGSRLWEILVDFGTVS
jgi:hypothetical protein